MDSPLTQVIFFSLCYLLGSIPSGLLVANLFKVRDLRSHGSGNIGATNVARVIGFLPAVFVFLLDAGKGVLAVYGARSTDVWAAMRYIGDSPVDNPAIQLAAGLFAVLGHCYSPWLKFQGGKGVSTCFGVMAVISPFSALAGGIGFGTVFLRTRISSLSSLTGLAIASVMHLVLNPVSGYLLIGAAMLFVIILRHEANIDALLENREKSFH